MTVLLSREEGWIISHLKHSETELGDFDEKNSGTKNLVSLELNPKLFEIKSPFKSVKSSKKSQGSKKKSQERNNSEEKQEIISQYYVVQTNCGETASKIANLSRPLIKEGEESGIFIKLSGDEKADNNAGARRTAIEFYEAIKDFSFFPEFSKMNDEGVGTKEILFDGKGNFHSFILPKDSVVHCGKVRDLRNLVEDRKYSLIVMDPPWRNKYIRRRKRKQSEAGYQMMEDWDISKLPIQDLTNDQAIVAVWCTNSQSHQTRVIEEFFPTWELDYVATWFWLKVTQEGLPVCPFNEDRKKQPFESIILGRRKSRESEEEQLEDQNHILPHPLRELLTSDPKVIISIPSSIHSHKPPLIEILRPYINKPDLNSSNCLELFARYALPGFTSVGDQVLKLMHESLFHPINPVNR